MHRKGVWLGTSMVVAVALAAHWWMATSVSPRMGVTADEVVHLTGGYSYWKFNDYRLHPENGTLPMRIAALPLLGMDLKFPSQSKFEWMQSKVNLVGDEFFFDLGNPVDQMLARARLMIAFVGAFAIWLTWRWAKGLFGPTAGWIALAMAVFCPAFLTHGGLATSDITMTACVLGALSLVWLALHRLTWPRLVGAMLACGLAFLSKMSGVLIVPLIAGMLVIRWLRPLPYVVTLGGAPNWVRRKSRIALATTASVMAIAAGSLVVLWGAYGFRYSGLHPNATATEDYYFSWDVILDRAPLPWPSTSLHSLLNERAPFKESAMSGVIDRLRQHRLLPEAYLWGFAHTYKFSRYRPAYFMGEHRSTGWRWFFPTAFLMKTTLPALLLIAAGVATILLARRLPKAASLKPWAYRATPLLLFFVAYWVMAIRMNLNIGHRHILPTYPVFYVLAAAAALSLWLTRKRIARFSVVALLVLHAGESLLARPFYISYFQPFVGGSDQGHRYFVDSSYDWGQGLPDLKRWLETKQQAGDNRPVHLTYFGADSPSGRGIDAVRFGDVMSANSTRPFPAQVKAGWYVMSATHFRRVYLPCRGPWTEAHEELYHTLKQRLLKAQEIKGPRSAEETEQLSADAMDYEVLQFCRLSYFLEGRAPREIIGGSLLAFEVSVDDINMALYAPRAEMEPRRLSSQ